MALLGLSLLCALVSLVPCSLAAPLGDPEPARHEELTLLFHGALQLGQSLNGVYRSTEAQLKEAGHSLGLYDRALGLLGQEVSQGLDAAQELRASLSDMQMEEEALKVQAEATAQTLRKAAQGQKVLWENMKRLEVQLQGARLGHARHQLEALKVRLYLCPKSPGFQPWHHMGSP